MRCIQLTTVATIVHDHHRQSSCTLGWLAYMYNIRLIFSVLCVRSQSALETVVEQAEPAETGEEKDERPEPLSEKQLNEVPIAIEVFSMEVVCRVHVYVHNIIL